MLMMMMMMMMVIIIFNIIILQYLTVKMRFDFWPYTYM